MFSEVKVPYKSIRLGLIRNCSSGNGGVVVTGGGTCCSRVSLGHSCGTKATLVHPLLQGSRLNYTGDAMH